MPESFRFNIPTIPPDPDTVVLATSEAIDLAIGQTIFVLGANGTGKSGLMHSLFTQHKAHAHRIAAHRQTWFTSNSPELTAAGRRDSETNISNRDANAEARWKDDHAATRSGIALYDLINAENVRARTITDAVDISDMTLAQERSKKAAPLKTINQLLKLANLPIEISVKQYEELFASKNGGAQYSIAQLSDGERNALLIAAAVLTVKPGTLLLIDEPERHLHRSIISPLLSLLFAERSDCAFVVSTHDVMLPLDNPTARTLLMRGCEYKGTTPVKWDIDLVEPNTEFSDELKEDILGGRRKIIFVEGTEQSLDKPLYSLIFPNVSIVAKESSRDVERAVGGIRDSESLHWVKAWGLVDNDRRSGVEIDELKEKGIHAIPVYSVESIYYHPELQSRVARLHASVTGEDFDTRISNARRAALESVGPHALRLSQRTSQNLIREEIFKRLPTKQSIEISDPIDIQIDVAAIVASEKSKLDQAIAGGNLELIIARYPVRETPLISEIVSKLGFQNRAQYESTVRKMLIDDQDALHIAKSLFDSLIPEVEGA